MSQYHDGRLIWWSARGISGIIFEEATGQRYFLHVTRIVLGPAKPKTDDVVRFEVDPLRPVLPGKLPLAVNVIVLPQDAPVSAQGGSYVPAK